MMWITDGDGWYVYKLQGVCFLSWVKEADKAYAQLFPEHNIDEWVRIVSDMAEKRLIAVKP